MQQFILNLNEDETRPIVKLEDGLTALLDTGASIPVWTANENYLSTIFGASLLKSNVYFSGFGGKAMGNLYRLPVLRVGNLLFPNIPIIASSGSKNYPFQMILSATMFNGLIYEINTKTNKLTITIPNDESNVRNLKIFDTNGGLHVLCDSENVKEIHSFN